MTEWIAVQDIELADAGGQDVVEYAILIAFIGFATIAGVELLGDALLAYLTALAAYIAAQTAGIGAGS